MKALILALHAAQSTLLKQPPESPLRQSTLLQLVETIPTPVLAHFLRLVEHGRSGVALVRHGVCSGCHLRIPSGQAAALQVSSGLHLCENCGSYLLLDPDEIASPPPPSIPPLKPRRGRPRARAAVPA